MLVYSVLVGGVTLHPPAHAALPLHEIFIKNHGNFQPVIICPPSAWGPAPGEAVLMQIRLQESTYYKQLTFVLIY